MKPSCFNCIHADIDPGHPGSYWDPPEPAQAYCGHQNVSEDLINNHSEDELPEKCGNFQPIMIEKCLLCDKPMNVPEYQWNIYASCPNSGESIPSCSEECKNAYDVMNKLSEENA